MPIIDPILGGAAGGFGGAVAGESLKPIFGKLTDAHRVLLLMILVFALFLWFVWYPRTGRRRPRV